MKSRLRASTMVGPDGPPMQFHHKACDHDVHADVVCSECHERIDVRSVRARLGPSHPEYVAG